MREQALAYAEAGFLVLPTYTVNKRGECGEALSGRWKPCPLTSGCRPGKHPIASLAPHAARSATSDPNVIAKWPERGYNLGIAGDPKTRLVLMDIDDAEIADALLALPVMEGLAAVRTRRGCHLYVRPMLATENAIIKVDGSQVGEIRADGQYVVAPPSRHPEGQYEWVGPSPLDDPDCIPESPGDGFDYIHQMLKAAGYEASINVPGKALKALKGGPVLPATWDGQFVEIPFETPVEAMQLRQLLSGSMPNNDRSGTLYWLACELYRQAAVAGYNLKLRQVASIVKRVDSLGYRKYTGRSDEDVRLMKIAQEAKAEFPVAAALGVGNDLDDQDNPHQGGPASVFKWDGFGFGKQGEKGLVYVCNFEPRITEQRLIWVSHDAEPEREWLVRLTRNEKHIEIILKEAHYQDGRSLTRELRKRLPSSFLVADKKDGLLLEGLQSYSGNPPERHVYAVSGWLPDREAFLLPGLPGLVTPALGYDLNTVFEAAGKTPAVMAVPRVIAETDVAHGVEILLDSVPASILIPLLSQIIAAPLLDSGHHDDTILFLFGPSNSFKTTVTRHLMSLYGYARDESIGITSWVGATEMSIRRGLHRYRELPYLVDDFKIGTIHEDRVIALIQSMGDRRGRERLNRAAEQADSDRPQALMIVTGEDSLAQQRSTLSRQLTVSVNEGDIDVNGMTRLQRGAESGMLGVVGVAWIRWLCGKGRPWLQEWLEGQREEALERIGQIVGNVTPRVVATVAALYNVTKLFLMFLREVAPEIADRFRQEASRGWAWQFNAAREQVQEGEKIAPLGQLLEAVRDCLSAGTVAFAPRIQGVGWLGMPGGRVIGHHDEEFVYFTKHLTYGWFREEKGRQHENVAFSWASLQSEVKRQFGEKSVVFRITGVTETRRGLRLPISTIDGSEPENAQIPK